MKYKIRINPVAIADVLEMKAYIAEDNPQAASKMGNTITAILSAAITSYFIRLKGKSFQFIVS